MRSKPLALGLLAALSFAGPFLETLLTGGVEPMGKFELGETFLALGLVYWWYHADKAERGYRAGPLMNAGVIALTAVALPVYFIRSRGWKRGGLAILAAAAVLAALFALEEAGERLGALLGAG